MIQPFEVQGDGVRIVYDVNMLRNEMVLVIRVDVDDAKAVENLGNLAEYIRDTMGVPEGAKQ